MAPVGLSESDRVIQSLWVGRPLSTMERLCIQSFLANGHEFHLYTFGEIGAVPEGTVLKDAREILSEKEVFSNTDQSLQQGGGSFAPFANIFRAKLLYERGGWWVDMDMVCMKPFDFPEAVRVSSYEEYDGSIRTSNNVMKFPAGDPLLPKHIESLRAIYSKEVVHGAGPTALHDNLAEAGRLGDLAPVEAFNPVSWRQAATLARAPMPFWHPRKLKRTLLGPRINESIDLPGIYAVHLWSEMWRRNGLDYDGRYPAAAPYERLKRRYLAQEPAPR